MPEPISDMPQNTPDERATARYKAARLAVIILSSLIILALIGLIVGGIRTLAPKPARVTHDSIHFALPHGARILDMQSQPGRLLVHIRGPQGDEIEIVDIQDGHLVASVKAEPPGSPP